MKSFEEIKNNKRCVWHDVTGDGFRGYIRAPRGWEASIVVSNGAGWEHISIAPMKKHIVPTWEDMCWLKDEFFNENEAVIEIHPAKSDYVNNMSNCLHLWRCSYKEMVLPPSCLVGIRKGQTASELEQEIKEAYRLAGEEY